MPLRACVRCSFYSWLITLLLLITPTVQAAGQLDQEVNFDGNSAALGIYSERSPGQTFTVGLTGLLDRFELRLMRDEHTELPLSLEVRRTQNGLPDLSPSALLYSTTVSAATIPLENTNGIFTGFDLGNNAVPVVAGQVLAICSASLEDRFDWYLWSVSDPANPYPDGTAVQRFGASDPDYEPYDGGGDLAFRTYVTVPEPGVFPLVPLVLACPRCRRRR